MSNHKEWDDHFFHKAFCNCVCPSAHHILVLVFTEIQIKAKLRKNISKMLWQKIDLFLFNDHKLASCGTNFHSCFFPAQSNTYLYILQQSCKLNKVIPCCVVQLNVELWWQAIWKTVLKPLQHTVESQVGIMLVLAEIHKHVRFLPMHLHTYNMCGQHPPSVRLHHLKRNDLYSFSFVVI